MSRDKLSSSAAGSSSSQVSGAEKQQQRQEQRSMTPKLRQTTLAKSLRLPSGEEVSRSANVLGSSLRHSPRKRVKMDEDRLSGDSEISTTPVKAEVAPSSPSSRLRCSPRLSPSPPPPRLPSDFHQVTCSSFLSRTITLISGVHYLPSLIPASLADSWYSALLSLKDWYHPTLEMYGKRITQSRAIIACSKVPGLKLKYSGQEVQMRDWPDELREMERRVREVIGQEVRFNHAMLNLYADGDTYIGRHSDNLENKVIVTLSLGAPRTWIMTKRPPRGAQAAAKRNGEKLARMETHRWTVENGSLLLMQGKCQEEWYHEIPKEKRVRQGRISVTLRQLVYE